MSSGSVHERCNLRVIEACLGRFSALVHPFYGTCLVTLPNSKYNTHARRSSFCGRGGLLVVLHVI
jgi:hypothetical protein